MQQKSDAKSVAYVVHLPTGIAYAWIILGFVTAGLLLYAFFTAAAFKIKLFRGLQQWSAIAKVGLFSGPVLIALGFYFSTIPTGYYMLIPLIAYLLITSFGWSTSASKSNGPP
jgi:hypothetical protein